tara:strand:+ start:76 stop:525 length:450 start_codon:yes stop_codon:yes gene_type:complete
MENSNDVKNTTKGLKGLIIVLIGLLVLTGLIDFGFGVVLQFKPEIAAMESNTDYVPELKGLISIFGITLLIFGLITLLSAKWVWKKKIEGTIVSIFSGLKLFIVSIVSFILNGDISIILYDGVRGAIIVVLAVVLYKKINFIKISEVSK